MCLSPHFSKINMNASAPETIEQFLDAEPITELNDSANLMSDRELVTMLDFFHAESLAELREEYAEVEEIESQREQSSNQEEEPRPLTLKEAVREMESFRYEHARRHMDQLNDFLVIQLGEVYKQLVDIELGNTDLQVSIGLGQFALRTCRQIDALYNTHLTLEEMSFNIIKKNRLTTSCMYWQQVYNASYLTGMSMGQFGRKDLARMYTWNLLYDFVTGPTGENINTIDKHSDINPFFILEGQPKRY